MEGDEDKSTGIFDDPVGAQGEDKQLDHLLKKTIRSTISTQRFR